MDIIEAVRQLGEAIQNDQRYKAFDAARKANDQNEELQNLVGEFNLARMSIDSELQKEEGEKDTEKIKEFNTTLRQLYGKIMCNDCMMQYNKAKAELDAVMNKVSGIIELCLEGQDPKTCEPAEGCTGSCSTCSGCH